jgi:hypothetical protein
MMLGRAYPVKFRLFRLLDEAGCLWLHGLGGVALAGGGRGGEADFSSARLTHVREPLQSK